MPATAVFRGFSLVFLGFSGDGRLRSSSAWILVLPADPGSRANPWDHKESRSGREVRIRVPDVVLLLLLLLFLSLLFALMFFCFLSFFSHGFVHFSRGLG